MKKKPNSKRLQLNKETLLSLNALNQVTGAGIPETWPGGGTWQESQCVCDLTITRLKTMCSPCF